MLNLATPSQVKLLQPASTSSSMYSKRQKRSDGGRYGHATTKVVLEIKSRAQITLEAINIEG